MANYVFNLPMKDETFESGIIFKPFIVFVLFIIVDIMSELCSQGLTLSSGLHSQCLLIHVCVSAPACWRGRVEWTRDTEYWERMVDDYQTQHGEGNETESTSNLSLCHRVSVIQCMWCFCEMENIDSFDTSKKFVSACVVGDLRNDGHSGPHLLNSNIMVCKLHTVLVVGHILGCFWKVIFCLVFIF